MIIITWSKDYNTDAICQVTNNYKITHPQNYTIKGQCYLQFRTVCYFLNIMPLIFQKKPFPQISNLIITTLFSSLRNFHSQDQECSSVLDYLPRIHKA